MYTLEQRWEILRYYFENHGNVAEYVRKLRTDFERREAASAERICLCIRLNNAGKWICDRLTEDADFGKSSLRMKLILILAGM